jgi:hypothetical protein
MAEKTVAQLRAWSRAQWTAEELRAHLTYDPETGEFWTKPRKIGTVQYFGKTRVPAVTISLKGKDGQWRHYYAHILAWLWMTGEWPADEIDHWNTNSVDNRWLNLREATHVENNRNKDFSKRARSGLVGAHYHKRSGLWKANIAHKTIGYFKTAEEAHEAYKNAAAQLYGNFAHKSLTKNPESAD